MTRFSVRLKIHIVGAGLGGLSAAISCALAGHDVVVLEGAKQLAEIGAGLQITPNASLLLQEWGLEKVLQKAGAKPTFLAVHRYSNGNVLAMEKEFNVKMRAKYGAPFLDLHRVDLQKILYERAVHLVVTVRLGARVAKIFPDTSEIVTESGEKYAGDLIVGADGLWSRCRESLLGQDDNPFPTGDLAYRIVLTLDQIADPELRDRLFSERWHNVQSCAPVLLCPDDLPKDVARQAGSVAEMRKLFTNWDPILTRFLDQVDTVDKWKLMYRSPLESWTNEDGTFVLIGDSCHPMLPYLAQGANSSIEDGGVSGRLLECVDSKDQLSQRIKLFEQLRKTRSEAIVRETFHQREAFHIPDGQEQVIRDRIFASQLGKEITCKFPSRWTRAEVQPWLYGSGSWSLRSSIRKQDVMRVLCLVVWNHHVQSRTNGELRMVCRIASVINGKLCSEEKRLDKECPGADNPLLHAWS